MEKENTKHIKEGNLNSEKRQEKLQRNNFNGVVWLPEKVLRCQRRTKVTSQEELSEFRVNKAREEIEELLFKS